MVYYQSWDDVLFMHWRVEAGGLARRLPPGLALDTREGEAWVSAVLFRLTVRPAWLPRVPGLSRLVELNVRTYVRCGERDGIWFPRVQADNRAACWLARLLTPLPYEYRPLRYGRRDGGFDVSDAPHPSPLTVRPSGPASAPPVGSLDEWLLERYRLYADRPGGGLDVAEVRHPPWPVRAAAVTRWADEFGKSVGLGGRPPDAVHFSDGVRAVFGPFRPAIAPGHAEATAVGVRGSDRATACIRADGGGTVHMRPGRVGRHPGAGERAGR